MTELQRRKVGFGLEQFAERLQVFKTQLEDNLAYCQAGGGELFFSQFNQFVVQMLLGVLAGK
jgi:hypothetical protein